MKFLSSITFILGLVAVILETLGTPIISEDLRTNSALIAILGLILGLLGASFLSRKINKKILAILISGILLNYYTFFIMEDGIYIFIFLPWIIGVVIALRVIFGVAHFISKRISTKIRK